MYWYPVQGGTQPCVLWGLSLGFKFFVAKIWIIYDWEFQNYALQICCLRTSLLMTKLLFVGLGNCTVSRWLGTVDTEKPYWRVKDTKEKNIIWVTQHAPECDLQPSEAWLYLTISEWWDNPSALCRQLAHRGFFQSADVAVFWNMPWNTTSGSVYV